MWRLTPVQSEGSGSRSGGPADSNKAEHGVSHFLQLLAKSPASKSAFLQAKESLAQGSLTQVQREEIALTVAAINGSNYCLAAHTVEGRAAGLNDNDIELARQASARDSKTRAMLSFVQAVVLQRGEVSDPDFAAVRRAGFSEGEIVEVLANVALNIFSNYFNLLAQTELDAWLPSPASAKPGVPPPSSTLA